MSRHQVRPAILKRYAKYSRLAKEIYMQYTDMVGFGLDECWLDVTGSRRCSAAAARLQARARQDELGLTVSNRRVVQQNFRKARQRL